MKKLLLPLIIIAVAVVPRVNAADLSFYSKTGYMDWKENQSDGSRYIRETGGTQEIGLSLTVGISSVEINQKLGLWGAVFAYDGVSAETMEIKKMTTGNMGVRYDLALGVPVKLGERVEITPLAGSGVNYFWRFVGPEEWLVLSARAGVRVKAGPVEITGGINYPYHTTDTVDWTDIGAASKVTVSPKGKLTPFVEAGVKLSPRWKVGVFYEPMKWGASESVQFRYTGQNHGAAIAQYDRLFQPETKVEHVGVTVEYRF